MAKYTVELGDVAKSGVKIFNFDYEFYDNAKKNDFEQKFINHFYFREIGQETVGRFQHYLKCKCDEELPYYNMLFKTAQMDYDLLNNYNLTETFKKTNSNEKIVNANANQNGTTADTNQLKGSLTRDVDVNNSSEKTNSLDSSTTHSENTDFTHNDTLTETGAIDKNTTVDVDTTKVGSDTPNALLSMTDIKNNVYASKADIEDGVTKTVDGQKSSASKVDKLTETTDKTVTDSVNAESRDTSKDNNSENTTETTNNTTTSNGTFNNHSNATQNENESGSENYTLTRIGNIGVDKPSDMLQKHIEFQKTMTTILKQFFDACEDLFMQLY